MNKLKVAWMYPDILSLHGERGNLMALKKIAKELKIQLEIDRIDNIDSIIDFDKYDILMFNAGQLKEIEVIKEKLYSQLDNLKKYINNDKVIFITGTTGALFADKIIRKNTTFNGLNILNMDIKEREYIIGDDLYYKANGMDIAGCQIQMIDIYLKKVKPFGKIKYGYGNIGNGLEGARYKNVIFTNALGPILVKNPWLTEYIIKLACKNIKIKKINHLLEKKSLKTYQEFINEKLV